MIFLYLGQPRVAPKEIDAPCDAIEIHVLDNPEKWESSREKYYTQEQWIQEVGPASKIMDTFVSRRRQLLS